MRKKKAIEFMNETFHPNRRREQSKYDIAFPLRRIGTE